jgi:hypothetical protein
MMNDKGSLVGTKQSVDVSSYQFNVQNLSSGVYYINVIAHNKAVTTLKFVKE